MTVRPDPPVAIVSWGIPPEVLTKTGSVKPTSIGITVPIPYAPGMTDVATRDTVGAVVSMTMVCWVKRPDWARAGRVSTAEFPAASVMVPVSAPVDT